MPASAETVPPFMVTVLSLRIAWASELLPVFETVPPFIINVPVLLTAYPVAETVPLFMVNVPLLLLLTALA